MIHHSIRSIRSVLVKDKEIINKITRFFYSFFKDRPFDFKPFNLSSRGDTIVEVLMSIAILAVVLTAGYVTANHSLRTGEAADQRAQALSTAQGQVEWLINAQNTPGAIDKYIRAKPFCINNVDGKPIDADATTKVCQPFNSKPYGIGVTYSSSTGIFTVLAIWDSISSTNNQDQLKLYYKLPGSYK